MPIELIFRRIISVLVLSGYLLSICRMAILESLHYTSHCFSSDHVHFTHSYYSHEDGHNHAGLDIIDKTDDTHQDSHNSTTTADTDKIYQIN